MQETNSRIGNATRAASSRFNRDGPPGEDDEEGLGYRAGRVNPARKAQFSRYQTGEEGESDDEREAEIDDNLNEILQGVKGLKMLASAQGDEVERQNKYLTRLHEKAGRTDQDLQSSTDRVSLLSILTYLSVLTLFSDAQDLITHISWTYLYILCHKVKDSAVIYDGHEIFIRSELV